MRGDSNSVLSCLERERLEEELTEARSRGRNLSRLRNLTVRAGGAGRARAGGADAAQGPRRGAWLPAVDVVFVGSVPAASGVAILRPSLSGGLRVTSPGAGKLEKEIARK